jgi:hypothetical protein
MENVKDRKAAQNEQVMVSLLRARDGQDRGKTSKSVRTYTGVVEVRLLTLF